MKVEFKAGDTIIIPKGCKAIVKDGSVVFEKVQDFKDGDILACNEEFCRYPFIFKGHDEKGFSKFYTGIGCEGDLIISTSSNELWCKSELSYATEEEKQLLFDKMKEQGLKWNAEEKRVERIRWRAEDGKDYYYVGNQGILMLDKEDGDRADKNRYKFNNYFRTIEQGKEAAKRVNETLRKYHEEIGE